MDLILCHLDSLVRNLAKLYRTHIPLFCDGSQIIDWFPIHIFPWRYLLLAESSINGPNLLLE